MILGQLPLKNYHLTLTPNLFTPTHTPNPNPNPNANPYLNPNPNPYPNPHLNPNPNPYPKSILVVIVLVCVLYTIL